MPDFDCLRCGTAMQFVGQHKLQLGKTSWIFGDLPNLMAGALDVSIMACPACGKLEFFTGDVALNVFQSLPVDGVIIVASPQDLVSMVVQKAVKMAQMMNIPIVGLVENMSYVQCPDCGKKLYIFGEGKTEEAAKAYHIPLLAKMPIDPALAKLTDDGCIEQFEGHWLDGVVETILRK